MWSIEIICIQISSNIYIKMATRPRQPELSVKYDFLQLTQSEKLPLVPLWVE